MVLPSVASRDRCGRLPPVFRYSMATFTFLSLLFSSCCSGVVYPPPLNSQDSSCSSPITMPPPSVPTSLPRPHINASDSFRSSAQRDQVGREFSLRLDSQDLSSPIRMHSSPDGGAQWQLLHQGATYLSLHFERLYLPNGAYIRFTDGWGGQERNFTQTDHTSSGFRREFSPHIVGDTIIFTLVVPPHITSLPTFVVDHYIGGFEQWNYQPESVCGESLNVNAACYIGSTDPETRLMYQESKKIARLLIMGKFLCTAFLITPQNHLLTNHHCIQNIQEAANTEVSLL